MADHYCKMAFLKGRVKITKSTWVTYHRVLLVKSQIILNKLFFRHCLSMIMINEVIKYYRRTCIENTPICYIPAILEFHQDALLRMDFIHSAQFLTKLPSSFTHQELFKHISQVTMLSRQNRRWKEVFALIRDMQ